jgi:hypothetical protein
MMRGATRRRLSWIVAGLALFLGAAVAAEALPSVRDRTASADPRTFSLPVAAATATDAPPIDSWVNTALDRPLFAQDRRPDMVATPAANDTLPRLSGIIRLPDTSLAIFQPASGGTGQVVASGAGVSGWTVTDITDEDVTLVRGAQITTLRLSFANRPVTPHRVGKALITVLHDKRSNAFLQP